MLEGQVQLGTQFVVAFAQGDADLVVFVDRLTLELVCLASRAFQPVVVGVLVSQQRVYTARSQVEVGVFLSVVQGDGGVGTQVVIQPGRSLG